ncbi:MAG: nucleotidyltransferase domain-containing protein [Planctomycetes bacterium]|nr:nucleotidyltransferase domain-containing protein [Planctomycetota bacterium]
MHTAPGFAELLPALLQRLRDQLPELRGTWLFGSQARGTAGPHSDVDLAVLGPTAFDPVRIFDLGLELGVLARRDVDLIDVRRAPTVLKKEILSEGKLIDCLDRAACERFTADSMALYVAFREELALAGRNHEDRR